MEGFPFAEYWRPFLPMHCCRLVSTSCNQYHSKVLKAISAVYLFTFYVLQFWLFSLCHPNWDIRRAAYGSTKKILAAVPQLAEAILFEFSNYLSIVREKALLMKMR